MFSSVEKKKKKKRRKKIGGITLMGWCLGSGNKKLFSFFLSLFTKCTESMCPNALHIAPTSLLFLNNNFN